MKKLEKLKIALMTYGVSISNKDVITKIEQLSKSRPLTLADYATTSGITLLLEGDIWVNAPIIQYNPNFVKKAKCSLVIDNDELCVVSDELGILSKVSIIPVPDYFNKRLSNGKLVTEYGVTHSDRIRISPIEGCAYRCKFCDLSQKFAYRKKRVDELIESISIALNDPVLPAKHIMISGGTPMLEDYNYLLDIYRRIPLSFPEHPVDIMMTPIKGLMDPVRLRSFGIKGLSINLEIYNRKIAKSLIPQKASITRKTWFESIEKAVEVFERGEVRSMLLLGLEPIEDTLRGVEELAKRGCVPVLSPFRPDPSTVMRDVSPPSAVFLEEVYKRAKDIANKYDTNLGPRCIPCQHNTLTFPDDTEFYFHH